MDQTLLEVLPDSLFYAESFLENLMRAHRQGNVLGRRLIAPRHSLDGLPKGGVAKKVPIEIAGGEVMQLKAA